jgi:ABC-type Na+ efflux pump permease subunit
MSSRFFSVGRSALIAGHTWREALHQRLPHLLAVLAAALVAGALGLRDFNFGAPELKFLMDAGFGAQTFFGAILAIVATAQLFFADIERRTVLMVLARPVRRTEFIFGKLGGVLLLLLGFCALLTVLLLGLLWWRETALMRTYPDAFVHGRQVPYAGVAWCGLVQWLRLGLLAALTLLVASYARSSLFAVLTGFFVLVICQLQHLARDWYGVAGSPWTRGGAWFLGIVFPDFHLFDVADKVADGGTLAGGLVAGLAAYTLGYIGVLGLLASYCFHHREL